MKKVKKIKKYMNSLYKILTDKNYRFLVFSMYGKYDHMDDKTYLEKRYKAIMNCELDLKNPKTFNEKLQWLKLNNRKPEYSMMVDKYEVRNYIAQILGEEYLIPILGVWDDPQDIDFDQLPNKFVLKCTHNSGLGMCICKDKEKLNYSKMIKLLKKGMNQNYYLTGREWPYKNVKHRIVAEKYMKDDHTKELNDYKFYCFNGEPEFCQVIADRSTRETIDFFDKDWNHQEFVGLTPNVENATHLHKKPEQHEKMIEFSRKLSKGIPFVRIDFYEVNRKLYFGEITFYPASGFGKFKPDKYNEILGDMIKIEKYN